MIACVVISFLSHNYTALLDKKTPTFLLIDLFILYFSTTTAA